MKSNTDIILDAFFSKLTKRAQSATPTSSVTDPLSMKLQNLFRAFNSYYSTGDDSLKQATSLSNDVTSTLPSFRTSDPDTLLDVYTSTYNRLKSIVDHNKQVETQMTNAMNSLAQMISTIKAGK
jgi:hypothetical protein